MKDILVKINGDASGFEKATNKAIGLSKSFAGAIGVSIGAAGLLALSKQLIDISDKYSQLDGRLRLVTKSTQELQAAQSGLYSIAQNTRVEYEATVDLYTRLARSTDQLGLSQSQLLSITDSINKALIVSGASGESASAALMQLGQGMASGTLRGEELNSVMEQTPRLAQMIADGLGITIGQLRQYGKDGKLSADAVSQALLSQAQKIDSEFKQMPETVGQAMVKLTNAFKSVVNDSNKASDSTKGIASAIDDVATTIENNKAGIIKAFIQIAGAVSFTVEQVAKLATAISNIPGGKGAFGGGAAGLFVGSRFGPLGAGLGTAIGASTGGIYDYMSQQKNFSFAGIRSKSYGATGSWDSPAINQNVQNTTENLVSEALKSLKLGDTVAKKGGGGKSSKDQTASQFTALYDNLMPVEAENKRYQQSLKLISEYYGSRAELTDEDDKLRMKLSEEHQKKLDEINGLPALQRSLQELQDHYKTSEEVENDRYATELETLQNALDNKMIAQADYFELLEKMQEEHQANLTKIDEEGYTAREKFAKMSLVDQADDVFSTLKNITSGVAQHNKTLFQINKVAAIAEATINTYKGVSKTLSNYPWPLAGILAAVHLAAGIAQVSSIASTSFNGGSAASSSSSLSASAETSAATASSATAAKRVDIYGLNPSNLYTGEQVAKLLNEFIADGGTVNIK